VLVPFEKANPLEYTLRSAVICIRCSMVVAIFGVNGIIDVFAGLILPLFFVMLIIRKIGLSNE